MFTLNILTPCIYEPYLHQKLKKVFHLPVYLSKIARWEIFSNPSNHSAFFSGSTLFALTSGKYSKCQLVGIIYNGVWKADATKPI